MVRTITAGGAALPDWVVAVAALLTQLGDAWFLYLGLALLYWIADDRLAANPRRVGATVVAVGLGALAVTVGLKSLFALPRPPGAGEATLPPWLPDLLSGVYVDAATGDGFGFPSGHAIGATMVYGALATFLDVGARRQRLRVAGLLISVIALTRLALGVHYLADVVAGVAVGVAGLWLFGRVARSGFRPNPDRAFFLAAVLGAAAAAIAAAGGHGGEVLEAVIALGGGLGGYAVWRIRGTEPAPVGVPGVVGGLAVVAAVFGSASLVASAGLPYVFGVVPDTTPFRLLAVAPLSFAGVALVVVWPTIVDRARTARGDEAEESSVGDLITEAEPDGESPGSERSD
ncbi:phosphatase PAP2 family protein [Halobaculum gomorrense]|uniref:Membrane-associated phospholipid phosphatase n=1 Tax=Halobaculum gomorrense TaxID=43928 RepID=A0A1M5QIQ0_9EURY|nr:phosphatase PAP2 family protein [Halobaculum gomorrense]SHH13997.1 Membrane-associated phospholipid phosphatase [Halobaculum gomorrense]